MTKNLTELIQSALQEDLSELGDITSLSILKKNEPGKAKIVSKENGIIAGGFVVEKVFSIVDPSVKIELLVEDGTKVKKGQDVILISGSQQGILTGERTALNFLCRMSGIATSTAQFVELTKNTNVKILDTRKTIPGFRLLEKYSVRAGGGYNHRIGLYDMVLIKENHITAAGGIVSAVKQCRKYLLENKLDVNIEVETQTLEEVHQAVELKVDRIMLDNMNLKQIDEAVSFVNKKIKLEVSGGVNINNISSYAATGIDYISVGQLTHSAKALDFSLLII